MAKLALLLVLGVWCSFSEGALPTGATGSSCKNSFACGVGHCCRNSNNRVITTQEGGMGIFEPLGGHSTGTCSPVKAQKGEQCDGACQCDTGLSCYRPMSGVCCPPSTCVDETYAKQQHAYWNSCFSNPQCAIPP